MYYIHVCVTNDLACTFFMTQLFLFEPAPRGKEEKNKLGPCLVHPEIQKVFKIFRHIESCDTCMKH